MPNLKTCNCMLLGLSERTARPLCALGQKHNLGCWWGDRSKTNLKTPESKKHRLKTCAVDLPFIRCLGLHFDRIAKEKQSFLGF